MPLSTVLGAQSLIKPGVCTTATRPASPYTGQMIYDTTVATTLVWSGSAWIGSAGKVLQVVQGTLSTQFGTTSTSFVTTGLTASITPSATSSKILILAGINLSNSGANDTYATLFRASTNLGPSNGFVNWYSLQGQGGAALNYLDSPSTTSATAYTVYLRVGAGTGYISVANTINTIILQEISAQVADDYL